MLGTSTDSPVPFGEPVPFGDVGMSEQDAADFIRALVDEAPPLTPEQRDTLATLLRSPSAMRSER